MAMRHLSTVTVPLARAGFANLSNFFVTVFQLLDCLCQNLEPFSARLSMVLMRSIRHLKPGKERPVGRSSHPLQF
jgi:hypothetical protein